MRINRFPENPLIMPTDVKPSIDGYEVLCAFNAGVIQAGDEVVMLMRVAEKPISSDPDKVLVPVMETVNGKNELVVHEFSKKDPNIGLHDPRVVCFPDRVYLTSISHLRLARSKDGINFDIEEKPALWPDMPYERYGLEDPRITFLDDTYFIVYKGVDPHGITQCLASTKDFVTWQKHGIIFCPENMDAMLFPEKINGKYAALHRPMPRYMGAPNMWIAYSEDLIHWGEHKLLLAAEKGTWEGDRIGGGAVPFLCDDGWVEIYHAADENGVYCLGALLLDKDNPEKVLAKSPEPMMKPEAVYETDGFMKNVVFTCGALVDGDRVTIYYGASDEYMAAADVSLKEMLNSLVSL
ncbi:MAG: glycoside hydrolase family 130 protein [Armatimonadota bacterium]